MTYKLQIQNTGNLDFVPPAGYVGEAECHKPALYKFISTSTGLSYLTCVVDDGLVSAGSSNACAIAQSGGMKIRQGQTLGVSQTIQIKTPIPFQALTSTPPNAHLNLVLQVNPEIEIGTPVFALLTIGNAYNQFDWLKTGNFPSPFILYYSPPGFQCTAVM